MGQPTGIDELVVEGHVACYCGVFLVVGTPQANRGRCDECEEAHHVELTQARLRFEVAGREFVAEPVKRKPVKPRTSGASPQQTAYRRAQQRALRRLASIHRPMYELLLAEEKAREGINPRTSRRLPRPVGIEAALLADITEAEEREARRAQAARLRATG